MGRSWCYTWHDPKTERISWEEVGHVRMAVWQLEKAPTTGKLHHQGYVEFAKPTRMGVLQRAMKGVHVEMRRGTREQAIKYCQKEESREAGPWTYGFVEGNEGQMVDFNRLVEKLNGGMTAQEVQREYPLLYLKYGARIKSYIADLRHQEGHERAGRARLVVFAGEAGTGKTLTVQAWSKRHGLRVYERSVYAEKYWPGYERQEVLLLDEFMGERHAGVKAILHDCFSALMGSVLGANFASLLSLLMSAMPHAPHRRGSIEDTDSQTRGLQTIHFTSLTNGLRSSAGAPPMDVPPVRNALIAVAIRLAAAGLLRRRRRREDAGHTRRRRTALRWTEEPRGKELHLAMQPVNLLLRLPPSEA